MQDRPTAGELLDAVRDFLEKEILPNESGRRQFHTRVAVNVLSILRREWDNEEEMVRKEWRRLSVLLGTDDEATSFASLREAVRELNEELSKKIRGGEVDDRWGETVAAVTATVEDKLSVANPSYIEDES